VHGRAAGAASAAAAAAAAATAAAAVAAAAAAAAAPATTKGAELSGPRFRWAVLLELPGHDARQEPQILHDVEQPIVWDPRSWDSRLLE